MDDICNLCGKSATLMCQRCMETYCSTNCQILDWRTHKNICSLIPPLIPIKDCALKNQLFNRSFGNESMRNRSLYENVKSTKRSLVRNPLKISSENISYLEDDKIKQFGKDIKKSLPEIDFTLKPKENKVNAVEPTNLNNSKCPSAWRTPYPYPENEFFDVMVQYVEQSTGTMWVTDLKYENPLNKLLSEINRNIDYNTPGFKSDEISVGLLVAAPLDNLFYRAEITKMFLDSKTCSVHLIDYGNTLKVSFKDLRTPIPIMRNLNAYAFQIRCNKQLPLETIMTIRVIGKDQNGVAEIEEKTSNSQPLWLSADYFKANTQVVLVKISENGNFALLMLNNEDYNEKLKHLDEALEKQKLKKMEKDKPVAEGDFVVALALSGWSRGLVMSIYRNYYLVYLLDVGRVSLVEQVSPVPEEYKSIPIQVFAIELKKMLTEAKNFSDSLSNEKNFTIIAQPNSKTSDENFSCFFLTGSGQKIAEVEAFKYLGKCDKVGVGDWIEPLVSGGVVHVTNALSHSEIYISMVSTKMYPKILLAAAEDCEPLSCVKKEDFVLAKFEDGYFRGKVLETANDKAKVFDADTGLERCVSVKNLRKPNLFIISCPYHLRKVKLLYLANVDTPFADNKALATLEQCQKTGAEFSIKFDSNPELGVELFLQTSDEQSLNKKLLPMLFEKRTDIKTAVKANSPNPPTQKIETAVEEDTPPKTKPKVETEEKLYTLDDLEIIPITCGDNVKLMITDSSTISKGYISAYDLSNKSFIKKLNEEYLPLVAKYCASSNNIKGYSPKLNEICLAVFDADKEWYRAMCINILKDDMFYVMFLDYGNMSSVHKSNIMPITKELMFPANANMCLIDGIPQEVPPKACEKFILATEADPTLIAKVSKLEEDSYLLSLKNMDKYF